MKREILLLQMAGASGAGKSTLAREIARQITAAVIDYDVVKSAALDAGTTWDMSGRVGYTAIRAIADSLLDQGQSVILDSPCRFDFIFEGGTAIAKKHGVPYGFIECVLNDEEELKQRIQNRKRYRSQRIGLDKAPPDAPTDMMKNRDGKSIRYVTKYPESPWLLVDTSQPIKQCIEQSLKYLDELRGNKT